MEGPELPRRQRVAAYAVIIRDAQLLLSRLAPYLVDREMWTLPGGGIDFGEHPRDAVAREVWEETGLEVAIGDRAWIDSGRRRGSLSGDDLHSVRIVYDGWVAVDAPEPRVVEQDGSTVDARWWPIPDVAAGRVPVVALVHDALAAHRPARRQRLAAYGLARRDDRILLTRISRRGAHPGAWTMPGGGVDHGEPPADALVREIREETGLVATVGDLLGVHDTHFTGTAPDGRTEDFHGVHLVFVVSVDGAAPRVVEGGGTSDRVDWIPAADVESGSVPVLDVVRFALTRG